MMKKNILVIGGGPGGYVAAIRASQLGADVTLIEEDKVGGTCLNAGCIPTKALLHTTALYNQVKLSADMGLIANNLSVDWSLLQKRKSSVVDTLVSGTELLLSRNNVQVVKGSAKFVSDKKVEVALRDGEKREFAPDAFIVATGSEPFLLNIPGLDEAEFLTSKEALNLPSLPKSMLLIGGGVIGVEFAYLFSNLGVDVTVVEMSEEILPNMDRETASILRLYLSNSTAIKFFTSSRISKLKGGKSGFAVEIAGSSTGRKEVVNVEKILVCAGRRPNTSRLNLESASLKVDRGRIVTNEKMETPVKNIYAIGDCASKVLLAHVASKEGEAAAENIMGGNRSINYSRIPYCVYTQPEFASVGMTEAQAKEKGYEFSVGRFPFSGNGKCQIRNEVDGFIKIIGEKKYGEILGVQILGPNATELIAEATLAMEGEMIVETFIETIHAHPSISEAMREAALSFYERAIHHPPRS